GLVERAEQEKPGGGTENGHEAGEKKGVNERPGVLDEEAGDDGSGDAGKIANEILQAGPAAGSARPGENLRDHPGVGNVEAVRGGGEEKKWNGVAGADNGAGGERESTNGLAAGNHGFANERDAAAAVNEASESETGADAGVDEGIDEAAMTRGKMLDDDSREAGIGGGFSDAEKKTA